jgi:hypothetical protein
MFTAMLIGAGCVASSSVPALAGTSSGTRIRTTKQLGLAGYHFRVSKKTVLKAHGTITVPTSTCGRRTRRYGLQIGVGFDNGTLHQDAIVLLMLKCKAGRQRNGTAQLVAGYHAKIPARPVKAGQTLRVRVTVKGTYSSATLVFPGVASYTVTGPGGRPTGADYALTLSASRPAHYTPVQFSDCTVNKRNLSVFRPRIWESITSTGKVDGQVSPLTDGTAFTITY